MLLGENLYIILVLLNNNSYYFCTCTVCLTKINDFLLLVLGIGF